MITATIQKWVSRKEKIVNELLTTTGTRILQMKLLLPQKKSDSNQFMCICNLTRIHYVFETNHGSHLQNEEFWKQSEVLK